MPPARKNVYPCEMDANAAMKRLIPCHYIDLSDFCVNDKDKDSKYHLTLKINKSSPGEISLKRSGHKLTVETKRKTKKNGEEGVEHQVRSFEIPEEEKMKEFGAQLSTDGLLSVEGPGTNIIPGRAIPIHIDRLPQMKPGTKIHYSTIPNWNSNGPIIFAPFGYPAPVKPQQDVKAQDKGDEEKCKDDPENMIETDKDSAAENADQGIDVPENTPVDVEGKQPDESG